MIVDFLVSFLIPLKLMFPISLEMQHSESLSKDNKLANHEIKRNIRNKI